MRYQHTFPWRVQGCGPFMVKIITGTKYIHELGVNFSLDIIPPALAGPGDPGTGGPAEYSASIPQVRLKH